MKPTVELEAKGLRAYEQARAFERLRTWRLPVSFTIFALAPAAMGAWMWRLGHMELAGTNLILALVLAGLGRFQWRRLVARHGENVRLLAKLETEYGDELPWVQVENHFAALEKLKRELAEERGE